MLQFVVVSQCLIEVGGLTQVYPAFVASHPSAEWLNIWIEAFFSCLFNLPLVKRCCAPALASRSSKPLLVQEQVLFLTPTFLACCYGDLAASCVSRQGNKTTQSCVFVWQWYEGNKDILFAFPRAPMHSTLAVRWPWHFEELLYNRPPSPMDFFFLFLKSEHWVSRMWYSHLTQKSRVCDVKGKYKCNLPCCSVEPVYLNYSWNRSHAFGKSNDSHCQNALSVESNPPLLCGQQEENDCIHTG